MNMEYMGSEWLWREGGMEGYTYGKVKGIKEKEDDRS